MVERLRNSIATGFLLQVVIADDLCALDSLFNVTVFQRAKAFMVVVSPHTSIEVGQQLQSYAQLIGFRLTKFRHLGMYLL